MNAKDLTSLRTEAKQRMDQAVEHGKKELSGVRTGRAANGSPPGGGACGWRSGARVEDAHHGDPA